MSNSSLPQVYLKGKFDSRLKSFMSSRFDVLYSGNREHPSNSDLKVALGLTKPLK